MEIDFATRCRLCLSWEETMLDLYAEFDQGISLCEILNSVDLKVGGTCAYTQYIGAKFEFYLGRPR